MFHIPRTAVLDKTSYEEHVHLLQGFIPCLKNVLFMSLFSTTGSVLPLPIGSILNH